MFALEGVAWAAGIVAVTCGRHRLFPISREALEAVSRGGGWGGA